MLRVHAMREVGRRYGRNATGTAFRHTDDAPVQPRLARCECQSCGTHANALVAHTVHASCPNCGASELVPLEGVQVILTPRQAPSAGTPYPQPAA